MKNILFLTLAGVGGIGLAACTTEVAVDESATVETEAAPVELKAAPDFDLDAFPSGTVNSDDLRGKIVIVDFWATWCGPCIKEIPDLNAIMAEHDPDKVAVLGITIQSGSKEDVAPFLEDFGIEYPVVMGDEAVENGFGGIIGYPTKFIVSPDWKIYKKYMGNDKKDDIEQDIRDLLGTAEAAVLR